MDQSKIPWTVEVLSDLGFHPRDAARLAKVLPPVNARVMTAMHRHILETTPEFRQWYRLEPAGHVLWALTNLTIHQAINLTRAGRGLLDVLVIYDAVETNVTRRMSLQGVDVALGWAMERRVPRSRLSLYISLGFAPEKAAALETDPAGPPPDKALEMLAALRRPC